MPFIDSTNLEILNPIYIYCFGIGGIVIYLLLIVLAVIFIKKDVDLNYSFGYRTSFALSSEKKWKWTNSVFMKSIIIGEPIFLIIHINIYFLSSFLLVLFMGNY